MTGAFLVGDAIKVGWEKLMSSFWLCCGAVVAAYLLPSISQVTLMKLFAGMTNGAAADWPFLTGLLGLVSFVMQSALQLGIVKLALNLLDKNEADITDLLSCFPLVLKYVISTLLYCIMVVIGLCFLVVPGIVLAIKFGFYIFGIVEKGLGPIEALKFSSDLTEGSKWTLFGLGIICCLISTAGLLCLVVGLIPAHAVCLLAITYAYRQMVADKGEGHA